jgi:metal-dependent hydrolase (beta-lactamase superfamily II)
MLKSTRLGDLVFLSRCHYDHTGGLTGMLKAINRKDVLVLGHPMHLSHLFRLIPARFLRNEWPASAEQAS